MPSARRLVCLTSLLQACLLPEIEWTDEAGVDDPDDRTFIDSLEPEAILPPPSGASPSPGPDDSSTKESSGSADSSTALGEGQPPLILASNGTSGSDAGMTRTGGAVALPPSQDVGGEEPDAGATGVVEQEPEPDQEESREQQEREREERKREREREREERKREENRGPE